MFKCSRCKLDVQQQLAKFWELEEPLLAAPMISTTVREEDGRFQVEIPLKDPSEKLGNSRQHALTRFYSLEKRLNNNPPIRCLKQLGYENIDDHPQASKIIP
ncbi:hypothetical protein NQ318_003043 [Aromia moschata]|uniref:Uncharacterized protein n=1 Tax=Aromia moschata TaxID=1265417 RepID=A0AAV8X161_9CUCU|nr:hypothetical protein NQ318_003043 [Aromia moschata]